MSKGRILGWVLITLVAIIFNSNFIGFLAIIFLLDYSFGVLEDKLQKYLDRKQAMDKEKRN